MRDQYWKKFIAIAFVSIMSVMSLTACETMEGMGEDVENAGDEIDEEL